MCTNDDKNTQDTHSYILRIKKNIIATTFGDIQRSVVTYRRDCRLRGGQGWRRGWRRRQQSVLGARVMVIIMILLLRVQYMSGLQDAQRQRYGRRRRRRKL